MSNRTATADHVLPTRLRFSLTAFAVMLIPRAECRTHEGCDRTRRGQWRFAELLLGHGARWRDARVRRAHACEG